MPDIGEGLTEAEIVLWLVAVGDEIRVGQPVVEVETAKTTVEIPATHAGTVTELRGEPGDVVEVGDVLFVVGGNDVTTSEPERAASNDPAPAATTTTAGDPSPSPGASVGAPVKAMPAVRKLASDLGVDLGAVVGTGPGGSITKADVETAARDEVDQPEDGEEREALTPTRRAIAAHMAESWRTIPHVTVQAEIRAERLLARRSAADGSELPVEAVVAESVLPLLERYPWFNARYEDDEAVVYGDVHLGFAVDTDAGLMVVVVDGVRTRSTREVGDEFERLAAAARERSIGADDVTGQTFTISNIGALGGGHGTPIIPLGTSAILSIGRAVPAPVVVDGALEVGLVAPVDLSYDHRLIDGGLGQRFLADLVAALEA